LLPPGCEYSRMHCNGKDANLVQHCSLYCN